MIALADLSRAARRRAALHTHKALARARAGPDMSMRRTRELRRGAWIDAGAMGGSPGVDAVSFSLSRPQRTVSCAAPGRGHRCYRRTPWADLQRTTHGVCTNPLISVARWHACSLRRRCHSSIGHLSNDICCTGHAALPVLHACSGCLPVLACRQVSIVSQGRTQTSVRSGTT